MNATTQRLCAWSGPVMLVLFGVGFWGIAGFVPPPAPGDSAEDVARMYIENQGRIRTGMVVCSFSTALAIPWAAVISLQMRRIEGRWCPLAIVQFASGAFVTLALLYPVMVWGVAAYRPDHRSAETTQTLNDLGWIPFVGIVAPTMLQAVAIGMAILRDRTEQPVFPRWVGYFNIWAAVLFIPGPFLLYFKTGPLAWDGIFTFYLPFVVFGAWYAIMFVTLRKAITEAARAAHPGGPTQHARDGEGVGH